MKKVANKKVTIDDLAIMVAKGFDGVHKEMNERFDKVYDRFDEVDKRFDEVDKRFDKVEKEISDVRENLGTTRMDVLGIGDRFVSRHEFGEHLVHFSLLEKKVEEKR